MGLVQVARLIAASSGEAFDTCGSGVLEPDNGGMLRFSIATIVFLYSVSRQKSDQKTVIVEMSDVQYDRMTDIRAVGGG